MVYQIWPRSFADSDGDGIGDLGGIHARLDYLAALGVDVLWLSPFYPSPQHDGGYDISDYQAIDPTYGTLDQFDQLLADVHARGMRLILDMVVNHTSDQHSWFQESRASRRNPKRDWYWWRPGTRTDEGHQVEPNNWGSLFSGPAWHLDQRTGEYYLHVFSSAQPDLNWENPEVRHAIYAMLRWWLDRGVDGFRLDVLNMLSKDPELPNGQVPDGARHGQGQPFFINGPRIHEFVREMRHEVFADRPDRLLVIGETPGVDVEQARKFTDPLRGEVDMILHFENVQLDRGAAWFDVRPVQLSDLKAMFARWQHGLAAAGWNSLYWSNHDQPRAVSRFGNDTDDHRIRSAKLLGTVLHLHRGTPFIFQGEELGMTNPMFERLTDFTDVMSTSFCADQHDARADPAETLARLRTAARDNGRSPVQWNGTTNAGFTTGIPWTPINSNFVEINADAARADADSVWHHYQRLIKLRHHEPAIVHGDYQQLLTDHPQIYAFARRHGNVEFLVLANFSDDIVSVVTPQPWQGARRQLTDMPVTVQLGATVTLQPWEDHIYRRDHRPRQSSSSPAAAPAVPAAAGPTADAADEHLSLRRSDLGPTDAQRPGLPDSRPESLNRRKHRGTVAGLAPLLAEDGWPYASLPPTQPDDPGRYHALFGRDSLITALQVMPVAPDVARSTLRTLAARQGRHHDTEIDEEPGKILHEWRPHADQWLTDIGLPVRNGTLTHYASADATSWFLVLLGAMNDSRLNRDLEPAWRAATAWLASALTTGNGLVYHTSHLDHRGLVQQGWRDSMAPVAKHPDGGGIVMPDGTDPVAPIADADSQAAALAALRAAETLEPGGGWDARAEALRARVSAAYAPRGDDDWVMAVDARGEPVPGAGSQLGWLLWAGALDEQATSRAVERLSKPDLLTPYGLRTLTDTAPTFSPHGYHRGAIWPFDSWLGWSGLRAAGAYAPAERLRRGILDALDQLGQAPELYAVSRDGRLEPVAAANHVQAWTVGARWALENRWDGRRRAS